MDRLPKLDNTEWNPLRPDIPAEIESLSPILYDYLRDQAETLRRAHNLNQAGDTTFPWEILTQTSRERQFTLGSLGRFQHPEFGLIVARYVQFSNMNPDIWSGSPVGWIKDAQQFKWQATNRFAASDPTLVVGVCGAYETPESDHYGWVIVHGVAIQKLKFQDALPRLARFAWVADETVAPLTETSGLPIGICYSNESDEPSWLAAGATLIDALSLQEQSQLGLQEFDQRIEDIENDVKAADYRLHVRLADQSQLIQRNINGVMHGIEVVSARVGAIDLESASAELTEILQVTTNYRNQAGVAATNAGDAASQIVTTLQATNEFRRQASTHASEARFASESTSALVNEAAVFRNQSNLNAQASASFSQAAEVSADEASVSALASQKFATLAQTGGRAPTFLYDGVGFTSQTATPPATAITPPASNGINTYDYVDVAGEGRALLMGAWTTVGHLALTQLIAGHKYQLNVRYRRTNQSADGLYVYLYFEMFNGNQYLGRQTLIYQNGTPWLGVWRDINYTLEGDDYIALWPTATHMRLSFAPAWGSNSAVDKTQLVLFELYDDTAFLSASEALTYRDDAAQSATDADASRALAVIAQGAAATSETNAGISASAAFGYRNTAETHANNAGTAAASASSSATLAAAVARRGLVKNADFANTPLAPDVPVSWAAYGNYPQRVAGIGVSPYAIRMNAMDNLVYGMGQTFMAKGFTQGYYVLEWSVTLNAGVLGSAGVLLQYYTADYAAYLGELGYLCSTTPDQTGVAPGDGVVGRTYHFTKLQNLVSGTMAAGQIYAMTNGYFGYSPKDVTWNYCSIRPATQEEIAAGVALPAAQANIATLQTVTADLENRVATADFEVVASAGDAAAALRLNSRVGGGASNSNAALEAAEIQLWNVGAGTRKKALSTKNGNVTVHGDLDALGAMRFGTRRIPVALQSFKVSASDGEVINFGGDLVNSPDLIFEISGLAPKTASEAYDVKALSLTSTGFTMYAKIITPSSPTTVNQGPGVNTGGGPSWRMHKASASDSSTGYYTFSVNMQVQIGFPPENVGQFETPDSPKYSQDVGFDMYVRPNGGAWTKIGTYTENYIGNHATLRDEAVQIEGVGYYANAIGQDAGGDYEFGIVGVGGPVNAFTSVSYSALGGTGSVSSATPAGQKVIVTVIPRNV